MPITDNTKANTMWRVITTGIDPKTPPGHIRLRSEAKGFQSTFLSVEEKDADFGDNKKGRDILVASYVNDPGMALWQWKLRPNRRECRVLLRSLHATKKLGVMLTSTNPALTLNGNMKSVAVYGDDTQDLDANETWEVEVIDMPTTAAAAAVSTTTTTSKATAAAAATTSSAQKDYAQSTSKTQDYAKPTASTDQVGNSSDDDDLDISL